MAKKLSMFVIIIVASIAFAAGFMFNTVPSAAPIAEEIKSSLNLENTTEFGIPAQREFVPANITLVGSRVALQNGCYLISFQVTDDQAFSISHGLGNTIGARPLTHDILKDVIDDFGIKILGMRIERFGEDIYYARMFAQQADKVLDIDMRPSDAIALSVRTKNTLYINQTMLKEKGDNICLGRG